MSDRSIESVVLIDDSTDDLFINKLVIKKSALNVEPMEFSNPITALSFLANNPSDQRRIIFLDINMPYLDGFEFLERYKETCLDSCSTDIIIMLTTSMHSEDKVRAESNSLVRRYVRKPLTVQVFNELVSSFE